MPNLTDLFNTPNEFEYEGAKYKIGPLTFESQAMFSRRLEQRARHDGGRAVDMPEDQQNAYMQAIARDIATGFYEWDGAGCALALQQPWGIRYAMYLSMRQFDPNITEELANKIVNTQFVKLAAILSKGKPAPKVKRRVKGKRRG